MQEIDLKIYHGIKEWQWYKYNKVEQNIKIKNI